MDSRWLDSASCLATPVEVKPSSTVVTSPLHSQCPNRDSERNALFSSATANIVNLLLTNCGSKCPTRGQKEVSLGLAPCVDTSALFHYSLGDRVPPLD